MILAIRRAVRCRYHLHALAELWNRNLGCMSFPADLAGRELGHPSALAGVAEGSVDASTVDDEAVTGRRLEDRERAAVRGAQFSDGRADPDASGGCRVQAPGDLVVLGVPGEEGPAPGRAVVCRAVGG